jgi:hypothetical protein
MKYSKETTLHEVYETLSVKGRHPSWKASVVRLANKSWNKSLLKEPCSVCGYSLHVNLCHVKDIHTYSHDATLGEVNDPDNIVVLCPNHHWEFDNGHIAIGGLIKPKAGKSYKSCMDCDRQLAYSSKGIRCVPCHGRSRETIEWPETCDLLRMATEDGYESTGRSLGVSGVAVRQRLKRRGHVHKK